MTERALQNCTEGPEGLIFLPGFPEGIDIGGNPERLLSGIEMAILTGRQPFEHIKWDFEATEVVHEAFTEERARILGIRALVPSPEL